MNYTYYVDGVPYQDGYFRVTLQLSEEKRIRIWTTGKGTLSAGFTKLTGQPTFIFQPLNIDGSKKDYEYVIASQAEIVKLEPARMNLRHEELEALKKKRG